MHLLSRFSPWMLLPLLAVVCYIQNMAFTWSSRSRNSGDPAYHRHAAWCSNGVYLLTHTTFLYLLYATFTSKNLLLMLATFVVYTLSTTEGSVRMMRILLKKEAGKRAVGASDIYAKITKEEWEQMKTGVKGIYGGASITTPPVPMYSTHGEGKVQ